MLVRALIDQGIAHIFWHPGGASFPYHRALSKCEEIAFVLCRHEVGACHMADGYARATGRPGVVMLTSGSGATNSITGIANAYMDSVPIIVICGRDSVGHSVATQLDETDMIGVSRPVVKHSYIVPTANDLPRIVREAVFVATSGRPGPVVIDLPRSAYESTVKYEYERSEQISLRGYRPAESGHTGQIRKALEALLQSERPVIYAGGGVIQGDASPALLTFAECLDLPVVTSLMGLGAIPGANRLCLGMLGMHGSGLANNAIAHSDIVLALGTRFDDRATDDPEQFCPRAKVIHVDIDPSSISKTIIADLPIVGPVNEVLNILIQLANDKQELQSKRNVRYLSWWKQIDDWRQQPSGEERHTKESDSSNRIHPQDVVQTLYDETRGEAFITTDVGQHQIFVAQGYKFSTPRRWVTPGGLGTMGFGLPAALGVQFAVPQGMVVCITGESSFLINLQELSTCAQYDLPIKVFCFNNGTLGMVNQWNQIQGHENEFLGYAESMPDFVQLVESFGHRALRATSLDELKQAVYLAFSEEYKNQTVFVDVWVDPNVLVLPTKKRGSGTSTEVPVDS
ncbi:MAG: biosynthetic-type acetolactate synthase large subunit [Gammaproteobacteria bacterium]|nr:biosynthetic-type acetolactate synthase large subunit [Gammaproteobacteria bacterium]MYF01695.1 biosynthetic-type acetolactate synthase large subunit [Gammaproteobacteria bacterium]MYI76549.1 biosynthetic-type acetolactate synthase large subunit [Gammaproteobacteria bacterium]